MKTIAIYLLLISTMSIHARSKHKYDIRLRNQPSSISVDSSGLGAKGKAYLQFITLNDKGDSAMAIIHIVGSHQDTALNSDLAGFTEILLPSDTYRIEIFGLVYTPLRIDQIYLRPDTRYIFKTSLGQYQQEHYATIYSRRKLAQPEIDKIIDDLSAGRKNELMENETCHVSWWI